MGIDATRPFFLFSPSKMAEITNTAELLGQPASQSIEEVMRFWDARPCNIRHSRAEIGTKAYFDEVEQRKYFVEPHIPRFAEFEKWKGKRVLEIGCGIGTDAVNFARAGADYTGIDLSPASLDLTRRRFAVYGLRGTFYLANAEELPKVVPVQAFDLVYSFGVIHHSPDPPQVVRSLKKYLGPESEFRLMLYAKHSWKNIMIDAGLDRPEAQNGCPVAFTYTPDEARELLKDFEILDLRQDHVFPYVVEKYVRYDYERVPWFQAMPEKMFRALEQALGWHTLIRCRLQSAPK
jgi:SAM-dependent methyltransferase